MRFNITIVKHDFLAGRPKIVFYLGLFFLLISAGLYIFLDAFKLTGLINLIQGHVVSWVGLEKINQLYFDPLKIFFAVWGILLIIAAFLFKFSALNNRLLKGFKSLWQGVINLRIRWFLIGLLLINVVGKIILLFCTSEYTLAHDGAEYIDVAISLLKHEGFFSHLVYNPALTNSVPYPVALFPPLFPSLLFVVFKVFGTGFMQAGLVNILFSSLLPVLIFILTWQLTKSKRVAVVAAIFLTVNNVIIGWSTQILTEMPFIFFTLLFFIFLTASPRPRYYVLAGISLGLAYLTRFQAVVLLLPIALIYFLAIRDHNFNSKKIWQALVLLGIAALVVVSPWLARNYFVFGNPLHTSESATTWLTTYQNTNQTEAIASQGFLTLVGVNSIKIIKNWVANFLTLLRKTPMEIVGDVFIFVFSCLGLIFGARKYGRKFLFLFVYVMLNYVFFSFFKPLPRYLYEVNPIFIFFAGLGFWYVMDKAKNSSWRQIIIFFMLGSLAFSLVGGIKNAVGKEPTHPNSMLMAHEVAGYFRNINSSDTIMIASRHPNFVNYFLPQTKVVILPETKEKFEALVKQYKVKYVVVPYFGNIYDTTVQSAVNIIEFYGSKELIYEKNISPEIRVYKINN